MLGRMRSHRAISAAISISGLVSFIMVNGNFASLERSTILGEDFLLKHCGNGQMWDSDKIRVVQSLVKLLRKALAPYVAMSKKKWSSGIDLSALSGEEWLRLLTGETNMAALVGWCQGCRVGVCSGETCQRCGAALTICDGPFWSKIGSKIRRTLQKNRTLLPQIKSDRENLYSVKHQPTFPPPLEWLRTLWEQASPPPHQPFIPKVHYQVANWIGFLRRVGLSKEEITEVLRKDDFPDGPLVRQGKDYANISGEDLRRLGAEFRRAVGTLPGSVKDPSEMWRTMKWVDRQRTFPMARLKGERVRERKSAET